MAIQLIIHDWGFLETVNIKLGFFFFWATDLEINSGILGK